MPKLSGVRLFFVGALCFLFIFGLGPVGASSANISHAYHTTSSIPDGSIVSLDPQKTDYVVPSNGDNESRLLGVAVASDDSLLAVDAGSGTTQVATTGTVSVLVSTLNGDLAVGDQVAASPFNGIGMKALPGSRYIGLAQTSFSATSGGGVARQVTDKSGKSHQVWLGYVRLAIDIGTNNSGSGTSLNSLQRLAKSLTGHVVSTARVVISVVVTLVAILSLSVLIYSSIYGGIVSIGRNPLAKYSIFRTMTTVLGMAAVTALIASLTVFLLLR
ncbi:MAG TPA: hypothetical protein VH234_05720 [Candidatus Saccharimonadales bacterium]|jgi:hypothetical protein|nr:hypothetical protein [Candidatus Saccharimonadales bacterium]